MARTKQKARKLRNRLEKEKKQALAAAAKLSSDDDKRDKAPVTSPLAQEILSKMSGQEKSSVVEHLETMALDILAEKSPYDAMTADDAKVISKAAVDTLKEKCEDEPRSDSLKQIFATFQPILAGRKLLVRDDDVIQTKYGRNLMTGVVKDLNAELKSMTDSKSEEMVQRCHDVIEILVLALAARVQKVTEKLAAAAAAGGKPDRKRKMADKAAPGGIEVAEKQVKSDSAATVC